MVYNLFVFKYNEGAFVRNDAWNSTLVNLRNFKEVMDLLTEKDLVEINVWGNPNKKYMW